MRRSAYVIAVLLVSGCTSSPPDSHGIQQAHEVPQKCEAPAPDFVADHNQKALQEAQLKVSPGASDRVGLVARDASVTVVAICLPKRRDLRLPKRDPLLVSGKRKVSSFGGSLRQLGERAFHFSYFPPTGATEVTVFSGSSDLATATFPDAPSKRCRLSARRPFHVLRCGALLGLTWQTGLDMKAATVAGMDVGVTTTTHSGRRPLGFYYERVFDHTKGLVVQFSTSRPQFDRANVILRSIDLFEKAGSRDRYVEFVPQHEYSLRLRPAG